MSWSLDFLQRKCLDVNTESYKRCSSWWTGRSLDRCRIGTTSEGTGFAYGPATNRCAVDVSRIPGWADVVPE